jgi:hemolysin III
MIFFYERIDIMVQKVMKAKDPGSAITHFIGMLMTVFATLPLLLKASKSPNMIHLVSLGIFALSMILLYTASTVYHTFNLTDKINKRLKKFDHMMIFILIAGTYTPICLVALKGPVGIGLLILIWSMALLGIILKAFWVTCPKWFSSVIYIAMGWTCVLAFSPLLNAIPTKAFLWLLAGGIIYTIGGVIYALKLPIFNNKHKYFGSHEIFHLFCMGGSACHFILMYQFIAVMP